MYGKSSEKLAEVKAMCTRASFPSVYKNVFISFIVVTFDALFTRTKGKYFQCIELAPTSAVNC